MHKKCLVLALAVIWLFRVTLASGQGVPPRYITINGITQDLLADRTWVISNVDTAAATAIGLADSVSGRVKYGDSLAVYATPKNVKDTASNLRAIIPDSYSKTASDGRFLKTSDTGASGNKISYTQWDLKTSGQALVALGNISPAPASGTVTNITTNSTLSGGPISSSGTLAINLANANTWTGAPIYSVTGTSGAGGNDIAMTIKQTMNQTSTAGGKTLVLNRVNTALGTNFQYLLDMQNNGTTLSCFDRFGTLHFWQDPSSGVGVSRGCIYQSRDGGATVDNGNGGIVSGLFWV